MKELKYKRFTIFYNVWNRKVSQIQLWSAPQREVTSDKKEYTADIVKWLNKIKFDGGSYRFYARYGRSIEAIKKQVGRKVGARVSNSVGGLDDVLTEYGKELVIKQGTPLFILYNDWGKNLSQGAMEIISNYLDVHTPKNTVVYAGEKKVYPKEFELKNRGFTIHYNLKPNIKNNGRYYMSRPFAFYKDKIIQIRDLNWGLYLQNKDKVIK